MPASMHDDQRARLLRKARSIELQAGHASPTLSAQLRSLASLYRTEADALAALPVPRPPFAAGNGMGSNPYHCQ